MKVKEPFTGPISYSSILIELESKSNPSAVEGMKRFGIKGKTVYGVPVPFLRSLARKVGRDHSVAGELWKSGIHEAMILATMIDDPKLVTENQMERWVGDFDSWDVCDQCCGNLFDKTSLAFSKAVEWSSRRSEFEKRAGFVLMAELAVHDKQMSDSQFEKFLKIIKESREDDRNFVKKAVNWSLRQIGKRNRKLNKSTIRVAQEMLKESESKSARWIASDALRELKSEAVQNKLLKS